MAASVSLAKRTKVFLLGCGCFNPVTHMHLRMFELARDALHKTGLFEVIGGVISPVNDKYGKKDLQPSTHRIKMLQLATSTSDWIRVDEWEAKQSEWNRTRLVLNHAKEAIEKQEEPFKSPFSNENSHKVHVRLLCGADMLESFAVPDLWSDEDMEAITGEFGMVVITRHGSNPEKFIQKSELLTKNKNNILIVEEWIPNEISATRIREAIRHGDSVKYLIPDRVLEYINEHQLYKS